ncbi:hypothetical protein BKA70DRAFT_1111299, partial [Coprinopsis sp. MPI-PUGE-AT-0042]
HALVFIPGPVVGPMFCLGYFRCIFLFFSCVLVASSFLVPLCTQYQHSLLSQGLAVGISRGCLFRPTPAVVAHWFEVKRSIPMAMIAIGSSLGGTTMSILARRLLPKVGFALTIQIHGLIFMGNFGLANLLIRRRRPLRNVPGGLFNSRVLKPAPLSVYCGSCFVTFLNSYTSQLLFSLTYAL